MNSSLFEDVSLGADCDIPGLLRISKHVARCPEFIALQLAYTKAYRGEAQDFSIELNPDIGLMHLFIQFRLIQSMIFQFIHTLYSRDLQEARIAFRLELQKAKSDTSMSWR